MDTPEIGRTYRLICREGAVTKHARFLRYEDGSGMIERDGQYITFELDQTTWRKYWEQLVVDGYLEVDKGQ
jgi:hypothetical protein